MIDPSLFSNLSLFVQFSLSTVCTRVGSLAHGIICKILNDKPCPIPVLQTVTWPKEIYPEAPDTPPTAPDLGNIRSTGIFPSIPSAAETFSPVLNVEN